jgi:capsular polysaccharide biosynthesis protein
MQVVEISIKEIIVHLLRKWKTIVAIALIVALGFVAFTYVKQEFMSKSASLTSNQNEGDALRDEFYKINVAIELTTFQGTSPDSYHITLATNDLLVKVVNRYSLILEGAPLTDILGNSVTADYSNDDLKSIVTLASPSAGLLEIAVKKHANVNAQQAARDVLNYLVEQNDLVTKSVTDHKLLVLSETTTVSITNEVGPNYSRLALVGLLVGIILSIALLTFIFLIKPTIQTPERINDTIGLNYLGGVLRRKNKSLGDLVAGTMRMAYGENGIKLISENMRELVQDKNTILFTGTVTKSAMEEIALKIAKELQQDDLNILFGTNINMDAETVKKLGKCDAVVLMERLGVSKLKNIYYEKERIEMANKPVIGYVLI